MAGFHGEYVNHILTLESDGEFWRIVFKNGETRRQIQVREVCIQSWYRNNDCQLILYSPGASYAFEGDPSVIDQIEKSLEAICSSSTN